MHNNYNNNICLLNYTCTYCFIFLSLFSLIKIVASSGHSFRKQPESPLIEVNKIRFQKNDHFRHFKSFLFFLTTPTNDFELSTR